MAGVRFEGAVQARTVLVLSDLVAAASRAGLPVLAWSVSSGNLLAGSCLGATDEQLRAAFEAWVGYLGASRHPERIDAESVVMLRALVEDFYGCRVLISADVCADVVGGQVR